jgi:hypothetical protein
VRVYFGKQIFELSTRHKTFACGRFFQQTNDGHELNLAVSPCDVEHTANQRQRAVNSRVARLLCLAACARNNSKLRQPTLLPLSKNPIRCFFLFTPPPQPFNPQFPPFPDWLDDGVGSFDRVDLVAVRRPGLVKRSRAMLIIGCDEVNSRPAHAKPACAAPDSVRALYRPIAQRSLPGLSPPILSHGYCHGCRGAAVLVC